MADTPENTRTIPKAEPVVLNDYLPDIELGNGFVPRMKRAFRERRYLLLCFLVPALLMALIYASMEVYPIGDESVLVLDLNAQYIYYFSALRDIITDGGSLLYTFRRALGGEFMGIIGYYIASPLSAIVALFPKDMMTEALLTLFLLKTGLSGLTFGIYIDRTHKKNAPLTVMFSTMYALSAYAVVMQHNTMWIDSLALLPLIILGVEELIKHKRYKLFIITLALSVFSSFYIGYMTCIFVALYFFFYYFAHNESERNPDGERNHLLWSIVRIGVCAVTVVGITAVMLWSSYYSLKFGKTDFTNPSYNFKQQFDFLDVVSKMYFGSYDTVRPEGWPFVYCGMLTFMLLPLFFFLKKVSLREKIATGFFVLFMMVCFNGSTIDMFWHGMQFPNWLNFRYSFMVCFLFLTLAYRVFEQIDDIGFRPVIFSTVGIAVVLIILQKLEYENLPDLTAVWASLAILAVYLLMMRGVTFPRPDIKKTSVLVLAIFIGFETYAAGLANLIALDKDVVYSTRASFRDNLIRFEPVMDELHEKDPGFYRTEKAVQKKQNDALAIGMFGLSNSTSTLNASQIELLQDLGLSSKSHWSKYYGATPATDSLLGIKYLIGETKNDVPDIYTEYLTHTFDYGGKDGDKFSDLTVYENPYAMSVAFGVDESVANIKLLGKDSPIKNPFDRMNTIISSMLGDETVHIYNSQQFTGPDETNITVGSVVDNIKYTPTNSSADAYLTYKVTVDTDDVLYMYIPTDYNRDCDLTVNGASKGTYFANETHRIVELGSYTPGSELEVKLKMKKDDLYVSNTKTNYFYTFDEAVFEDAFTRLRGSEFDITDWTEDTLCGTINVQEGDEYIFTTIPYDEGWKVTVDGENVPIEKVLDSLIAFRLTPGEHEVTMKYRPTCAIYGSIISVSFLLLFIVYCVVDSVKSKKKKTAPAVALPEETETEEATEEVAEGEETSEETVEEVTEEEPEVTSEEAPEETPETEE